MNLGMSVCMFVRKCVHILCIYVSINVFKNVLRYIYRSVYFLNACKYEYMNECGFVYIYVIMCLFMHLCMDGCIYMYFYICTFVYICM